MATGDIYRASVGLQTATGDQNINNTTLTKIAFEDELETNSNYSMSANNEDLTCVEAGHYLIGWALYGVATANDRQMVRGAILRDGAELTGEYGTNAGYCRNNANNTIAITGMGIITTGPNQVISIATIRTATNTTAITQQDLQGGFWVIKISDAQIYARIQGAQTPLQTLSATNLVFSDLNLADNNEVDTGFTHTQDSTDITLANAGLYLVMYGAQFTNQSTQRRAYVTRITLDGVIQHETHAGMTARVDGGTATVRVSGFAVIRASASDILRISAAQENEEGGGTVPDVDNVWIDIMRFETDIDVLRQPLTAGSQEANPAAATVIDYDVPTEIDSATFVEAAGRVTVQKTGHYLLTSSIYNVRQDTNATRVTQRTRARLNTTNDTISGSGSYNRGNQGADDNFISVTTSQFLTPNLAVNDIIDFTLQEDGDAVVGSLDIIQGGQTCFRIEDLAGVTVVTETHTTDSILKKLDNEITHTTDSFLGTAITVVTETHTTDSYLKAIRTLTHTTDSFLIDTFDLLGVTRDRNLITVASCRVVLFKQDNAAQASRIYSIIDHANSDGSGNFTFTKIVDNDAQYMVFSIKLDSPQIRGVTDDDLQPV